MNFDAYWDQITMRCQSEVTDGKWPFSSSRSHAKRVRERERERERERHGHVVVPARLIKRIAIHRIHLAMSK